MSYLGDFSTGSTVELKFNTHKSDGTPITLAGTPAVSVYKDSTTETTTGVTLTVDYDSRTGLHRVSIDTSDAFYAAGKDYDVVITAGTVDSISVVGSIVGRFSIQNRSALRPTVSGRTLDVTSTGAAGIDWANVENPTTTINLSGTTIKTATDVETDTQDIQSRIPAALVSGRLDVIVGAYGSGLAPLQPTVSGRTLDVTATGAAGIDWANVENPTTTLVLSGTTIGTCTTNTDMRGTDGAALASNWTATRASYLDLVLLAQNANQRTVQVTGSNHVAADMHESQSGSIHTATFDAGALTDAVFAANSITAAKVAADVGTEIATAVRSELAVELARIDQTIGSRSTLTQADIRTATGLAAANLDSQLAAIKSDSAAILDDTGTSGVVVAAASKSGYALSSTGLDLVLVDGVAAPKALQIMAASVAGKVSGAGTSSEIFKGLDGITTRMTVTADESGNRSNVVYVTT